MGQILDGRTVAERHKKKVLELINRCSVDTRIPKLAIIMVGNNKASAAYVNTLLRQFEQVGIETELIRYDESVSEKTLLRMIYRLNIDEEIDGIIIQSPLPIHLNRDRLFEVIDPNKDVDGFHLMNSGKLYSNNEDAFIPCTANSIITILNEYKIPIEGTHVVVVGRSNVVGKPAGLLLLSQNATVTYTHSKTLNLSSYTKQADILIAAVGVPNLITKDMIKEGAVLIDAGINDLDGHMVGDIDTEDVMEKCGYVTPVPGGVGPVTIAMLMENTIKAFKKNYEKSAQCYTTE